MNEFLGAYSTFINIAAIIITLSSMGVSIWQASRAKTYADKVSQTQTSVLSA